MRLTYAELRRLAGAFRRRERPDLTLEASDIVHEVCVGLIGVGRKFNDSEHFFRAASLMMRRLLVDYARRHVAQRRGGTDQRVPLEDFLIGSSREADRIINVDVALAKLEKAHPRWARVVELHFFCGLTRAEIADSLASSEKTVRRDWQLAKAWLRAELPSTTSIPITEED
jgi:RNA polymerase sigma factor (TIGR02999 family)